MYNQTGVSYPLRLFAIWTEPKFITADKSGVYQSISIDEENIGEGLTEKLSAFAKENQLGVSLTGQFLGNQQMAKDMVVIFLISIALLYLILAIQFENLLHPLIVIFTMPLGIAGAMAALYFSGGSLDVMAAIGFIVVLGVIVDDPILK